jgi:hypothetical protein
MKTLACLILTFAAIGYCNAQTILENHVWKATLKIIDDAGLPVSGANASIFYDVPLESTNTGKIVGLTDASGEFTASHRDSTFGLRFLIDKPGYYSTDLQDDFGGFFTPEKLNPNLTLVLKKIGKPIPMYVKSVNLGMPILDKPVGFDFTEGDWASPYGKGVNTDIIFTGHFDKSADGGSDYTLTVSFPRAGDGIQEFVVPPTRFPNQGSGLRSPHNAPLDGYQARWVQIDNRKPGKPAETNRDMNHNYFIRVRTILDENGNVKSALYGKIYGDFLKYRYYLNPTPNDSNVEFDPNQNLLGGLKSIEQVHAP